ncbi:ClpP family protease [Nonomuraea antimicrobica]
MNAPDGEREPLLRHRTIVLGRTLVHDSADRVVADLLLLAQEDPLTDIVLLIDCPGGSVEAGFGIVDTMAYVTCDVVTYATGTAAGMGHVILAAGAKGKRYALPRARVTMRRPQDADGLGRHVHARGRARCATGWPRSRLSTPDEPSSRS